MKEPSIQEGVEGKETDFQKAMKFYDLVLSEFGADNLDRLTLSFPRKYNDKVAFLEEFQELELSQQIAYCNHNLREAYAEYKKRQGQDIGRKNILWVLMLCKQKKVTLQRDYYLMKMIKYLWLYELSSRQQVRETLKKIFTQIGQYDEQKVKLQSTNNRIDSKMKKTTSCGCIGENCLIF